MRDRIFAVSLIAVAGVAWIYLLQSAEAMHAAADEAAMHAAMGMTMPGMSGPGQLVNLWVMWSVMMVAMMLPSAAPIALLVLGTFRRRAGTRAHVSGYAFVLGYLVVWTGFSAAAAALQVLLERNGLVSPQMIGTSSLFVGAVLLAAGVYQWLPIKNACLRHCRSPIDFLTHYWREGIGGAFAMGARHGMFCVGCCWALMVLLFAVGVMNLLWVAAIAAFVLIEKQFSTGPGLSRTAGVCLGMWGAWLLIHGIPPA